MDTKDTWILKELAKEISRPNWYQWYEWGFFVIGEMSKPWEKPSFIQTLEWKV